MTLVDSKNSKHYVFRNGNNIMINIINIIFENPALISGFYLSNLNQYKYIHGLSTR